MSKLWETCIVPEPKRGRPSALKDHRLVAVRSHVMRTFERLVQRHLRTSLTPQYVMTSECASEVKISNTSNSCSGRSSSTLALFAFYDDSSIVGCINKDNEEEYRGLGFVTWCSNNHLKMPLILKVTDRKSYFPNI